LSCLHVHSSAAVDLRRRRFSDAYCHRYSYSYGDLDGNSHGNSYSYAYTDSYPNSHGDSNCYSYCNVLGLGNSYGYCSSEDYADAQAATYASPAPISSSV
jgi:hypothetical protein